MVHGIPKCHDSFPKTPQSLNERQLKTHYKEKFVLLGYTGYIGEAFQLELASRGEETICLSRAKLDYTKYKALRQFLEVERPHFLINCAGFTGKPNVDACESRQADAILGNVVLPQTVACACESASVPWGQVSSGCIYSGAKLREKNSASVIARDLMQPEIRNIWERDHSVLVGFSESDPPNFSFRNPPCSFYSGTKAVGEEVLQGHESVYIWRLRIPFDHVDNPRNYLSKIQNYARVYDNVNSLSHRADFVKACLALWERRAEFGTYNVTNPGFVTTREVASYIAKHLRLQRPFEYFQDDTDFYNFAVAPRSNTVLDVSKLLSTGVKIRDVHEAICSALTDWNLCSVQ